MKSMMNRVTRGIRSIFNRKPEKAPERTVTEVPYPHVTHGIKKTKSAFSAKRGRRLARSPGAIRSPRFSRGLLRRQLKNEEAPRILKVMKG